MYTNLPVGTRLVSLADPNLIGEVTWSGLTRGIPDVIIQWGDGRVSQAWVQDVKNPLAPESNSDQCPDCGASDPWVKSVTPSCAFCGFTEKGPTGKFGTV